MQYIYLSFHVPVCKAVVDEVEGAIDRVSPNKKVEVGSFRLDGSGNLKQTLVCTRNNSSKFIFTAPIHKRRLYSCFDNKMCEYFIFS